MIKKTLERVLYTVSLMALMVVATLGLSSTAGFSVTTAFADEDFELEAKKCLATPPQGCTYFGCTNNCSATGCNPRCQGTGNTCGDPACE